MEVIECDRCKKRIGEKAKLIPADRNLVKVKRQEKLLCSDCEAKLERFMAGEDDLRTEVTP